MPSNKLKLERNQRIANDFIHDESLIKIGKKYNITRQRADQIIKKLVSKEIQEEIKNKKILKRLAKKVNIVCQRCGKNFLVNPCIKDRKFCNKNCMKLSPEENLRRRRELSRLNNQRHIENGYVKEYYQKNKERIKEYIKKNRLSINKYQREWRKKNKDKVNKKMRKYYWKNRDKILENTRKKYKENKCISKR